MTEIFVSFIVGALAGVVFTSIFASASDADKAQELEDDEDKRHSGLLEE